MSILNLNIVLHDYHYILEKFERVTMVDKYCLPSWHHYLPLKKSDDETIPRCATKKRENA